MSQFRLKTFERRVGVVGLYNSGKTVLLTSLINHLEHHDPDRFRLGRLRAGDVPVSVRKFERLPPDAGWPEFNFAGFRDALVHKGRWPDKTKDRAQFACRFERADWSFSDCLLKLYDLPGERLADAAMLGRSYAEWSDHVDAVIRNDTPCRKLCGPYLDSVANVDVTESDVLASYKLALANLILSFKPMVSPSTFLLDPKGSAARPAPAEELAASRIAGTEPGAEFAPLPAELRAARPELVGQFARRYERYREDVVAPFVGALRSCHSLIVLIDVTTLLAGGVGMYDDNRQILRDLFHVLEPGESPMGRFGRQLAEVLLPRELRPTWIHSVAFVAPKADLVHPDDRDRMLGLMRRMVGKLAENRDGLRHDFFNCAAVVSARALPTGPGQRVLVGVPFRDGVGRRLPPGGEQRFAVSDLPDDWPADWEPGRFIFPEVYPTVPTRKDYPPEQLNVDRLLDFVLG